MEIELRTIDELRRELQRTDRDGFTATYPGAFLLAMGFLATEDVQASVRAAKGLNQPKAPTAAVSFGAHLRHVAGQSHPLAGCAFFMRPTGEAFRAVIGRSIDCDITVPDPSVSELHCRLQVRPQGVVVIDLRSTNGTIINMTPLQPGTPCIIADEDILSVGRYSFQMLSAPTMYDELALLGAVDSFES